MIKGIVYSGFLSLVAGFFLLTATIGCSYDKEELLYPELFSCDTTAVVKYSSTVLPIMTASCYECHTGLFPSGAIRLDNYADLRVYALDGRLFGTITHNGSYPAMPRNAPKLDNCKIASIKRWIDAGAQNN
jgi:hypothetical protein